MTKYKSGDWGGYEANVYYSPEDCGLEIVASMEREPDYDFNIVLLLRDKKTKNLWAVQDSGCSCPTPFEDVHSFADMTSIRSETGLVNFVDQFKYGTDDYYSYPVEQRLDLLRKGRVALRKRG